MSWGAYQNQKLAKGDFQKLQDMRRTARDRRRKKMSDRELVSQYVWKKRAQFDLALHRRGLTSPFDYEYPRFKQMNTLARELHQRYLKPIEDLWKLEELIDDLVYCCQK
jgi:hypothetical protein